MPNEKIKKTPAISIIMPVYKVERYLMKAVNSILNQSFDDFELYLVDDGSPDKSGEICDDLAILDERIKVIHQENGGAYRARNAALKEAIGKYVCFFDSDDHIEPNMLNDLYNLAESNDAELVISGFYIDTYTSNKEYFTMEYEPFLKDGDSEVSVYKDKESFRKDAYKEFEVNMFYSPWNKLYRLDYIKKFNLTFPETYRDDFPFVMNYINDVSRVVYTKNKYYHFIRKREESETQKYVKNLYDKREEEHKLMFDTYKYWGLQNDKDSMEMISRRYLDRLIECMTNLYNKKSSLSDDEKKDEIKKYLSNENVDISLYYAKPKKLFHKLMYKPLKMKSVVLCSMMASFINYVKYGNVKLFNMLKKNRND